MLTKPDGSLVQLTYEQRKCSTACLANGDACHECIDKFSPSATQHPLLPKVRQTIIECVQLCRREHRGCRACVVELQTGPDGGAAKLSIA